MVALCTCQVCYATDITGTVKDAQSGEPIIGATITLKSDASKGTVTDINGAFHFTVNELPVTIVCSYVGYTAVDVEVKDESSAHGIMISLSSANMQLSEVKVRGKARKSGEAGMIVGTKNSDVMQTGVSSQQIGKAQDKDASEAIKRIAGISLQDNRFVMVRGLSQRYNNVWLNGSAAPSSEADSRAFSFDIIPSSQIDNIVVIKSPSPEYPADFSGGMILVETKDIPLSNSLEVNVSGGANIHTTFTDYKYGKGSWSDVLGFDGGLRSLDGGINSKLDFIEGSTQAVNLLGNGLNNDWKVRTMNALPDMGLGANLNRKYELRNGTLLGLVATLNWSNSYKTFKDMSNNLFGAYDVANDRSNYLRYSTDNQYNQKSKLCTMLNLAYHSTSENTELQWTNMLNQLGHSRLIDRIGLSAQSNNEQSREYYYSSRTTLSTQLSGTHKLSGSELKWTGNYAYSNKNMPDRRRYVIDDALTTGVMQLTNGNEINREWTYLSEHTFSGTIDWHKTLKIAALEPAVMIGTLFEHRHREYTTRNFIYNWNAESNNLPTGFRTLPVEQLMDESNYGIDGLHLLEEVKMRNNYKGNNTIGSGYLTLTLPIRRFEFHGGVRFEHNTIELINNTRDYEKSEMSMKYHYNDFFPSVNIKYTINELQQIRAAYGRSCNRPEFRELSSSVFYDFDLASDVQGNTELKTCYIQNAEIRYELYPSAGEQLVVGAFVKHFDKPIEWTYTVAGGTDLVYSYENAKSAYSYGVELDARLKLDRIGLPDFIWTFNGALIHSRVKFEDGSQHHNRQMQGQSPYIINTGLYWSVTSGWQAAVLYNRIGKRIVEVGRSMGSTTGEETTNIPDSYEMPRNIVDLSLSKQLGSHWVFKLAVRDMLAERVNYNQIDHVTFADGSTHIIKETTKSYRPGCTIQIGGSYKF